MTEQDERRTLLLLAHERRIAAVHVRRQRFAVERVGQNRFFVRGDKPRRWVRQTDFGNDEAVTYLADRLARPMVEEPAIEIPQRRAARAESQLALRKRGGHR